MAKKPSLVFIDSNIYLSFYGYSKNDLVQLEKLAELIAKGAITFYVTTQVKDEVARNREGVIADAMANFQKNEPSTNLPLLIHEYEKEAAEYVEACRKVSKLRGVLVRNLKKNAFENSLKADLLFEKIVSAKGINLIDADKYTDAAQFRKIKGNPPGKGSSTGDQINWEALLSECPNENLIVISNDGDFSSDLDREKPNNFLLSEWKSKKKSDLILYTSMGVFLNELDGTIKLESEARKNEAISEIVNSTSFANTHSAIANAEPYVPLLTSLDIERLAESASSNTQISQIHNDPDVHDFFHRSFREQIEKIRPELKDTIVRMFFDDKPKDKGGG